MPPFEVAPAAPADIPGMIRVYNATFLPMPIQRVCFPKCPADSVADAAKDAWLANVYAEFLSRPEIRTLKVTEVATGKLVAWARWGYPAVSTDEKEAGTVGEEMAKEKRFTVCEGVNQDAATFYLSLLDQMRKKHYIENQHYILLAIGTDPEYRRRGIATMMMDPVIELADQEGRKIYTEATSGGRPLYQKYGFKDIDLITMDLRRWGGEGLEHNWVMMREPKIKGSP